MKSLVRLISWIVIFGLSVSCVTNKPQEDPRFWFGKAESSPVSPIEIGVPIMQIEQPKSSKNRAKNSKTEVKKKKPKNSKIEIRSNSKKKSENSKTAELRNNKLQPKTKKPRRKTNVGKSSRSEPQLNYSGKQKTPQLKQPDTPPKNDCSRDFKC